MNRRDFLRTAAGAALAAAVPWGTAEAQGRPRPNIVVILADDLGFSDLGCYGAETATPHLDRLSSEGLRFTHFYNAARCCPTRAALLTGLYPHQAGMGAMVSYPDNPRPAGPYQGYLNDRCVTLAEALKPAGYRTYMSGKWHVGEAPEHWPRRRGFDRYFGLISGASSYYELLQEDRVRRMALDDDPYTPAGDDFYMTDAFTDFAVRCLDEHGAGDDPFFLYLAYTAPHWPLHAPAADIDRYRDRYRGGWDRLREERYARQVDLGVIDPRWRLSPRDPEVPAWDDVPDQANQAELMAIYAAMVDRMDQGIGRVLDALRRRGAEDNTLVLFVSDNGGCHESVTGRNLHIPGTRPGARGSFLAYERPWANASNTPFRMHKHWIHEGGIATPCIVRWPQGIDARGRLTHEVAHITDILPTCLDIAGVPYPEERQGAAITPCAGRSLLPAFRGGPLQGRDALYWEHMGNRAIRRNGWKLVAQKDGPWELYDMAADRTELYDLAGDRPELARTLHEDYARWARETGVV